MSPSPVVSSSRLAAVALLAAGLAGAAQAVPFNLGGLEGQFDSRLNLSAQWASDGDRRELIGVANGGKAPAASGDDARLNFARGDLFSQRFTGWHALELKQGEQGFYLSGRYWYDFALKDQSWPFASTDGPGRARGARAAGAEWLEAFVWRQYQLAGQPGRLRLGRQILHWGEGVLIPGGLDVINPYDAAIWRAADATLADGRLPVNLLHGAQVLDERWSLEAFVQLEWRPTTLDDCASFLAQTDYLADGCNRLDRPFGVALPRGGDREARDSGQIGLALRYHAEALDSDFAVYALNYHSRLPLVGLSDVDYVLAWPEDIHLYGLSFATTLASGSDWRGELSYRPNALLQPSIGEGLAAGGTQPAWQREGVSQLQTSLEHRFDGVLGASLALTGELAWIHLDDLDGRYGRDPLFGPGGCVLPAGASGRYCENEGFTTRNAWGYRLQARASYPQLFAGIDLSPRLAWSHDVDGNSPAPEAVFVEERRALTLGLDAEYRETWRAGLAWTDYSGGRYSTLVDRDRLSLELGVRF